MGTCSHRQKLIRSEGGQKSKDGSKSRTLQRWGIAGCNDSTYEALRLSRAGYGEIGVGGDFV